MVDGLPLTLDELFRGAPAGLCIFDVEARYVWVSELVARMNACTPDDHVGHRIVDIAPHLADRLEPVVLRVAATGNPETLRSTTLLPGEIKPRSAAENFYPLYDGDGDIIGVANVWWETTEVVEAATRAGQDLEAERAAREAAQVSQSRLEFVARAARALTGSLEVNDVLAALVELAVPEIADWATAYLRDGTKLVRVAEAHNDGAGGVDVDRSPSLPPLDVDGDSPAAEAFRTGAVQLVPVPDRDRVRVNAPPGLQDTFRELGIHSGLAVPLLGADERPLGVLAFAVGGNRPVPGAFEVAAAGELAARAGIALDHAIRFDRERLVADALRRTILPDAVPAIAGVDIAAAVVPAARWARVGGDWYDTVAVDGSLVVAVGDVAGHGVAAASTMAEARHAFRAYAAEGHPPQEIATRVARLFSLHSREAFVTAVIIAIDLATGRLDYVNAGHPPPLMVTPGGSEYLPGVEPPLGVSAPGYAGAGTMQLPDGAAVVLFTDGLVERRGSSLDAGFEELAAFCSGRPRQPSALVAALTDAGRLAECDDDVCVVAVRRREPGDESVRQVQRADR